jgi:hypothetical protein
MAMIVVVLGTVLLSALSASLVMVTSSEAMAANNFRRAQEGLYVAEAVLERALDDVRSASTWDLLIDGSVQSSFVDGSPSGTRTLPDGSTIDLERWLNLLNCRQPTPCSALDLSAIIAERPWGSNNPVWRLYAYGPLRALLGSNAVDSSYYGLVVVADNPARLPGVLWLRSEAVGPGGTHRAVEMTLTRQDGSRGSALSWRDAP